MHYYLLNILKVILRELSNREIACQKHMRGIFRFLPSVDTKSHELR